MKALLILLIGIVGFAFFLFGKVNNANLLLSHEDAAEKIGTGSFPMASAVILPDTRAIGEQRTPNHFNKVELLSDHFTVRLDSKLLLFFAWNNRIYRCLFRRPLFIVLCNLRL